MKEALVAEKDTFIIGVVSDTHVPDRVRGLHPALLDELRGHKVDLILHAGDVAVRSVISALEQVAPVRLVTGNRDILLMSEYPVSLNLTIHQTVLTLTHGHLDARTYWGDKFAYITRGYSFARYQKRLARAFPLSNVIVYGHTHHAENAWVDGRLYFNPGSVSLGDYIDRDPKFGLLKIHKDGRIDALIYPLKGALIDAKEWVATA
jgi:putative phosphoesterase